MGILIIIFVGVALLAFILGDFLTSGAYFMEGDRNTVGSFDGETVKADRYSLELDQLERFYQSVNPEMEFTDEVRNSIADQLWSEYQYKFIFAKRLKALGLSVGKAELDDAFGGKFIDPSVRQQFTDPATGQFNVAALEQTINTFADESAVPEDQLEQWKLQREQWRRFEQQVEQNRLLTKYTTMIQKGLQVTTREIQAQFADDATNFSFRFVGKNYFETPDSTVQLTDEDYKKTYDEQKYRFKSAEAVRTVKFGLFRIMPSKKDSAESLKALNELREQFAASKSDTAFINEHSDVRNDPTYVKRDKISRSIDSVIFNAANGTVAGPYVDANHFTFAKKMRERLMPDSAKARMIFIANKDAEGKDVPNAKAKADSLMNLVKGGAPVKAIAAIQNDDPALKQDSGFIQPGGWISWELIATAPIFDSIFAQPAGTLRMLSLPTGYAIVNVEAKTAPQKQVMLAYLSKEIRTDDGQALAFAEANNFLGAAQTTEDFEKLQKSGKYLVRDEQLRESSTGLSGVENSRKMINWAFTNEKGKVSELELIGDKYVVMIITSAREPGIPKLDDIRDDATFKALAIRDKKAAQFSEQLKAAMAGGSIDAVATAAKSPVNQSGSVSMNAYNVPGVGNDPALLGAAAGAAQGKLVGPIKGRGGVYVLVVDSRTNGTPPPAIEPSMKAQFSSMASQRAMNDLQRVILEDAKARDMRYKLYQ